VSPYLRPEDLLEHTAWMTTLARGLVLDEGEAEDLVQQALVEVAERRPDRPRSLFGWLRSVVQNQARKAHRSQLRRRGRELAAARPERLTATPADVVERAEMHRLVVDRVLALPEPYREAVLLRYFEELSAAEVAERQDVPLATARTRLQRGLERLRRELDAVHGGDRGQWLSALLPIAGVGKAPALAGGSTGSAASASVGAAWQSAGTSAAGQVGLQALTTGGLIVSQKMVLTTVLLSAASLVVGGVIGRYVGRMDREEVKAHFQLVEGKKVADLEAQLASAKASLKSAEAERARLKEENDGLAVKVAGLDGELKAERDKAAAVSAPEKHQLALAFGKYADLEGLAGADWPEMGGAVTAMTSLLLELFTGLEKGEPLNPELQKKIQEENTKLVRLAAGIMGKIPTHALTNGEFSHPLVLSNLLSAALEESGVPLTPAQKKALVQAGAGYDAAYERLQTGYTKETTELEKMVDELALKHEHIGKARQALTPEQQEAVLPPTLRDRMQIDILSPGVSTILSAQPKTFPSAAEARSQYQARMIKDLGIDAQLAASLSEPFDAWQEEVATLLAPRAGGQTPPRLDEALIAARAEVNLLRKLLATPGLSDQARAAILGRRGWIVPQVSEAKGETSE
jgi:RNA polymerase sigma-70 factor (ECF subfamily)